MSTIIKGNEATRKNWEVINKIIINNLRFSMDKDSNNNRCSDRYSLDRVLGGATSLTKGRLVSAEAIIKCIGEEFFKRLIQNSWDKDIVNHNIKDFSRIRIRHLVSTFSWVKTPEGYTFWNNIRQDLINLEGEI